MRSFAVPSSGSPAWRALFGATLLWAMTAGTLIQFLVGVLAPFLAADLGISRAQIGALAAVFSGVGAVCSPLAGPLVDRLGGRRVLLAMFAVAGVAMAGMGAAPGYGLLLAAAGLGGLASAAVNPVTNQLVAVHLPRGGQGVIVGIKQSGVQVGAFLSGALVPAGALALGWRTALLITAGVAAAGILAALAVLPRGPQPAVFDHDGQPGAGDQPGRSPQAPPERPKRFVTWLSAYGLLMGAGGVVVPAFVVLYAVEQLAWSETAGGAAAATAGGVAVAARMVWGRAAERLRTSTAPLLAMAAGSTAAAGLIWAAQAGEWLLWPGVVLFGVTAGSWNAVAMLAIVREVDPRATGWASGVMQSAFYVGLMVGPPAFGWMVDATGGYDVGWAAVVVVLLASTALTAAWHRRDARRAAAAPAG